jgi:hypothetical protein
MVSNGLESPREIIALGAMLDTILDGGTCKGGVTSCKAELESEDFVLQIFPNLENRKTIEHFELNWNGSLTMSWDDETLDTTQSAEANSFYQCAPALKHVERDTIFETLHTIKAYTEDNDIPKMVERDRTNFTSDLSGSSESSSANDRSVLLSHAAQEQEQDKIDNNKRVMPVSQKREAPHDSEINSRESFPDQQDNNTTAKPTRKTVRSFLRKFSLKLMNSRRGSTKSVPESSSMVGAQLEDEKEDDAGAKRVIKREVASTDDTNVEVRTIEEVQTNENDTDVTPTEEVGRRSVEDRDNYHVQKMEGTKVDRATGRSIPSSVEEIEDGSEKEVIEMATGEVYIQISEQGFEIQKFQGRRLEL